MWLITNPKNGLRAELDVIFPQAQVVDWEVGEDLKVAKRRLSKKANAVAEVVRQWVRSGNMDPLFYTDVRHHLGIESISNFNKLVDAKGFQLFLDNTGVYVRKVDNRKAFVRVQTEFDELQAQWRNLHEELEELQGQLGELEEAGVDEGPEFEKVHGRLMEVASELGLLH